MSEVKGGTRLHRKSHFVALGNDRQPRHVFADNNIRPVRRLGTPPVDSFAVFLAIYRTHFTVFCPVRR